MEGGSPQKDKEYTCKYMKRGSEKFYILLPRTDVDLRLNDNGAVKRIDILNNKMISIWEQYADISYEFNPHFECQNIGTSSKFEHKHKEMLREGKINSKLDKQYLLDLMNKILYYNGKEWTANHSISNPW